MREQPLALYSILYSLRNPVSLSPKTQADMTSTERNLIHSGLIARNRAARSLLTCRNPLQTLCYRLNIGSRHLRV
jgi:hypothetical protein